MNVMQRAAAIGRLQEMAMMLQIPGAVKFGGGAWRCFQCGAEVQPKANYCSHCGKRLEWPDGSDGQASDRR